MYCVFLPTDSSFRSDACCSSIWLIPTVLLIWETAEVFKVLLSLYSEYSWISKTVSRIVALTTQITYELKKNYPIRLEYTLQTIYAKTNENLLNQ